MRRKKDKYTNSKKPKRHKVKYRKGGHSDQYWYNLELKEWEWSQVKLAYKEASIRRKKNIVLQNPKTAIPKYDSLTPLPLRSANGKRIKYKIIHSKISDHLRDDNGDLIFYGKYPASQRPKPILQPNGDRSPEDLILNPRNPKRDLPTTPRAFSNFNLLQKLMRELGVKDKRRIVCSDPTTDTIPTVPEWTDKQTSLLRKATRLMASPKSKLRRKGTKLHIKLKDKYPDKDFTIAWYRIKEERKEWPYVPNLPLRIWYELRSDALLKLYGIAIPMPSLKR